MTAWETIVGQATNPSATFTALTYTAGQSGTVRNTDLSTKIMLQDMWAKGATAGSFRIRSPRLHDNVNGILFPNPATLDQALMGWWPAQPLVPQDQLIAEITGGAAETDLGAYTISYDSLPGSDGVFATCGQILPRIVNIVTNEVACTSGTVGAWGTGSALNATYDLLHANTWYAILGYVVSAATGAVAIQGPDIGNLRVGGPGNLTLTDTRNHFINRDLSGNVPAIPVINSANKAGTTVYTADNTAALASTVALVLAELSGSSLPG